jgi:uncharacterized membrane protein YeiH
MCVISASHLPEHSSGILLHKEFDRIAGALIVIDAAALGLYAVAGSTRATDAGLGILPALLLGAVTAAGGGAWRDVLAGRTPRVFQPGQPYVLVALAASAVYLGCRHSAVDQTWSTVAGCLTGFLLRMTVVHLGWATRPIGEPATVDERSRKP